MLALLHDFEPQTATAQQKYAEQGAVCFSQILVDKMFHSVVLALGKRLSLLEEQFLPDKPSIPNHPINTDQFILEEVLADFSQRIIRLEETSPGTQSMLYEAMALCPEMLAAASQPTLIEIAKQLLNSETIGCHPRTLLLMSLPHQTWHLGHWHQDWHYNRGPYNTATFYIPLHTVTSKNGSLLLALKEHQKGPLPHESNTSENTVIQTKWETLPESITSQFNNVISTELNQGDLLCFNSLTPHSAQVNQSDQIRFVLNFRYLDLSDPEYLAKGWHDPAPSEIQAKMRRLNPQSKPNNILK